MTATPESGSAAQSKPSFKTRLRAWWEGYEVAPTAGVEPAPRPAPAPVAVAAGPVSLLDRADIKLGQQVWGESFLGPGGESFILGLVKPFALNPSMTVMHFGAGLGGGTRAISNAFELWVGGFEADAAMASAAQEISMRKGTKKAEIKAYAAKDFLPKAASFDCIFSGETLYTLQEKEKLLGTFERVLKPRGQIVITDFVRASGVAADDPRLAGFPCRPGKSPYFWTEEDYQKRMKALKFDVRVDEDLTATYRGMVIDHWVNFTASGDSAACAKSFPDELVSEVGFWTQRVAALDSGAVLLKRYYAIKMGSGKPSA